MLKGIKKGKKNQQIDTQKQQPQIANKQVFNQQQEKKIQKSIANNQNDIKSQFIMEQEQQHERNYKQEEGMMIDQHQSSKVRDNVRENPKMNFGKIIKDKKVRVSQESLQQKALQVMSVFSSGSSDILRLYEQYQKLEKQFYLNNSVVANNIAAEDLQSTIIQQKLKGKFEYNMNFQQDQEDQNSKARKKQRNRSRPVMKSQKIQDYCIYCPDNQQLKLLSASNYVYLAFPKRKTFKKYWHFILAPVQHQHTSVGFNDQVMTEIKNYKKCLLQMFDKKQMHVVFFEQYCSDNSHIFIQCLAVPLSKGEDFPFFFKQALQSVQGNWTTHKNIIKIQKDKGGIQKQIPKKFKYFYIDFSLGYGYAHAIENERFWKRQFCHQVLATALNLEMYQVKSAQQYTQQQNQTRQLQFKKMWQPFDWTKMMEDN